MILPPTLQITPDNPLVITTEGQLEQVLYRVLDRLGYQPKQVTEREQLPAELPTRLVKKYLAGKGYRCATHISMNKVLTRFGVTGKKRGKENWYSTEQLQRIPNRK